MIAEMPAMIAPQHNDGVLHEAEPIQFIRPSELRVHAQLTAA
jgi:hypothetical protein